MVELKYCVFPVANFSRILSIRSKPLSLGVSESTTWPVAYESNEKNKNSKSFPSIIDTLFESLSG